MIKFDEGGGVSELMEQRKGNMGRGGWELDSNDHL